ncbi:MAG: CYTH and CHAD domain-containing protein [Actinobacteria bacterium]|nr:CYTH and CHAD domain-containing protein [Actinomycetota bacterium]MDQ3533900.1 CYTH and CHAD domain-containing protein [Actinomycetota bacterium]
MRETELKLALHDGFELPVLEPAATGVAAVREHPPADLEATYFDTADLRLARNGITLRHRTGEDERNGWALKLPLDGAQGQGVAVREEHFFPGGRTAPPPEAVNLVTAYVRGSSLGPVAKIQTQRRSWALTDENGGELAELAADEVSVLDKRRKVVLFRELELEARALDRDGLDRIAGELTKAGAALGDPTPKLVRVLGQQAAAPPDLVQSRAPRPEDPAGEAVRAAFVAGTVRLVANDPGARLGGVEPLHQMRVALRRLRSDIRTFAPLVEEGWAKDMIPELRWLGRALGAVRDQDVLLERLRASAAGLEDDLAPLFETLEASRRDKHSELLEALSSKRYERLVDSLTEAALAPPLTEAADRPCAEVLPPLVEKAWKKVAKRVKATPATAPAEDLHGVRIHVKRVRYAAEAVGPSLRGKKAKRARQFADRAAALQDVLGANQDTVVARRAIAQAAGLRPEDAAFGIATTSLFERQQELAIEYRYRYPKAWAKLDRPKRTKWMRV